MRKVRFKLSPDDLEQYEGWVADEGHDNKDMIVMSNKKIAKLYLEGEDWMNTPGECCIWIITPEAIIEELEE